MNTLLPDEIICQICGRPNKKAAVRCWYCQTEFEKEEEDPKQSLLFEDEVEGEEGAATASFVQSAVENDAKNNGETVPEWLKRIREIKASEDQENEEKEDWQQESFLDGEQPTEKNESTPEKKEESSESTNNEESQNSLSENTSASDDIEEETRNLLDDLPQGFTKLSTDD